MGAKLFFTDILKLNTIDIEKCSIDIRYLYYSLNGNYNIVDVKLLDYSPEFVCLRCIIKVDIPSRGTVANIDIKKEEPILMLVDKKQYPYKAPYIFTDRIDFPHNQLPHMNVYNNWFMPGICLHRGSIDDWYSEHTIDDFIVRIRAWFRDAAANRLIKENDQFEPTRIVHEDGFIVYEPDNIINFIQNYWNDNDGSKDYGFLVFKVCKQEYTKDQEVANFIELIALYRRTDYRKMIKDYKLNLSIKDNFNIHVGLFVWPSVNHINHNYFGKLPVTIDELITFGESVDCKIFQAINFYAQKLKNRIIGIPLICAVKRPNNLIGRKSDIELLNFVILGTRKDKNGNYQTELPVKVLTNKAPITSQYAKDLSAIDNKENPCIAVLGCGALGSKISTYLSRCGYNKQFIIDNDRLLPHNVIRHSLFFDSVGKNKAEALIEKFNSLFYHDNDSEYNYSDASIFGIIADDTVSLKDKYKVLCDFSASSSVMNCLVNAGDRIPKVIRAELGFSGKLGIMFVEGKGRNPGIDEIQAMFFKHAIDLDEISKWLNSFKNQREKLRESELEEIIIGLSCSSNTMRLADDIISQHAAVLSVQLRKVICNDDEQGEIVINYFDIDNLESNYVRILRVPHFIEKTSICGKWKIKIAGTVHDQIMKELENHSPNETGGILIGQINKLKKVIYVVDTFTPEDSERYPYAFIRGIKDVPQYIKKYSELSGGLIGYAGEWHTHPKMDLSMSCKDKNSFELIRDNLRRVGLPTHIAIFNEKDFVSYIY